MHHAFHGLFSSLSTLLIIAFIAAGLPVQPAQAAGLISASDTMSRLIVDADADHEILFTTTTTIGSGEVVELTFPSDFDGTGVTFADFAVYVDTADGDCDDAGSQTVVAGGGELPGEWGISLNGTENREVQLASGGGSAQADAGDEICIQIGLNAGGSEAYNNPSGVGDYIIAVAAGPSGNPNLTVDLSVPIVDSDQVNVTASVDATITFDLDTAVGDTDTDAPYTVNLGTITPTDTRVSGATDGINGIWADLDSNATGGVVVTVQNANGASGLVSASAGGDFIPAAGSSIGDGIQMYGLCVVAVSTTVGTLLRAGDYVGPTTCAFNDETNDVETISITANSILSAPGPLTGGRAQIAVGASIAATTPAHNDYTDTLTFIATGTF